MLDTLINKNNKSSVMAAKTYSKRKPPVWKNGGRGKITTISIPKEIRDLTYNIAIVLDNEINFDVRVKKIREILNNSRSKFSN